MQAHTEPSVGLIYRALSRTQRAAPDLVVVQGIIGRRKPGTQASASERTIS